MDSINVNNFCCNSIKTSKNCYFWSQLGQKKGKHRPRPKSKSFYFIIVTCFERVVNVFLFFVMFFLPKRVISSEISCVSKVKYLNAVMAYAAMVFFYMLRVFSVESLRKEIIIKTRRSCRAQKWFSDWCEIWITMDHCSLVDLIDHFIIF